jgi:hypothetical protein
MEGLSLKERRAAAMADIFCQEYLSLAGHDPVTGLGVMVVAAYHRALAALDAEHLVSEAMKTPPVFTASIHIENPPAVMGNG